MYTFHYTVSLRSRLRRSDGYARAVYAASVVALPGRRRSRYRDGPRRYAVSINCFVASRHKELDFVCSNFELFFFLVGYGY